MKREIPKELGVGTREPGVSASGEWRGSGEELTSVDPTTEGVLGKIRGAAPGDLDAAVDAAAATFPAWRDLPAPRRGEYIRRIGDELRRKKRALATLVTLECGKILSEGEGEVQEMIDMADFAVGLSRMLGGRTMPSERPSHRMFEQWHPLGPVGVISAFNFPVAVWSWNAFVAAVCGDTVVWKPSEKTPLTSVAVQKIVSGVMEPDGLAGVFNLANGGREVSEKLARDRRLPLISATGSCGMGHAVARTVAERMGRVLLELGGNNAVIVLDDADLDLAFRAVLFGALGTAGQRCTTTRRLLVEKQAAAQLEERLLAAYPTARIGDPLDPETLVGPLIDRAAVELYEDAIERIRKEGGEVLTGGRRLDREGFFVEPTLVRARADMPIVREETFAPILYLIEVSGVDEAIEANNSVPQGFSSSIFTRSLRAAERFLSARGSDCGIANVNIGTSGAEIGGAFGGEKETGGGREAGSDSWKAYMRRQTCTVNYGTELPLAQGVKFDV